KHTMRFHRCTPLRDTFGSDHPPEAPQPHRGDALDGMGILDSTPPNPTIPVRVFGQILLVIVRHLQGFSAESSELCHSAYPCGRFPADAFEVPPVDLLDCR